MISRAQWRIANAVKVTHVRHGRGGNTSPSSPLVLPGVPAGHVARFSPPSLYSSRSDRGYDLSSWDIYYIVSMRSRTDSTTRIVPILSLFLSYFFSRNSYIRIQMISVNHFIKLQQL